MSEQDVATEVFKMRLSAELKGKLESEAKRLNRSTSDLVRGLVEGYLNPASDPRVATEVDAPAVGKYKSITLDGMPVRDKEGNVVPSMSLAEAYLKILVRTKDESKLVVDVATDKKVCVSCGTEDPGTELGNWAYTVQQRPICQKCARERAGV